MRKPLAVVLAATVASALALAQDRPKGPAAKVPAAETKQPRAEFPPSPQKKLYATNDLRGKQAPKLEVSKWLNKEPDTKGKVVIIDFWATWCPPCRKLIPELEAWQAKYKNDLVVIGISDEKESVVRGHFKKSPMKYAMAIDENATMKTLVGVNGIPHVLVIGTDNVVRWQGFPASDEDELTEAKLKQIIDADKARRASEHEPKTEAPAPKARGG